MWQISTHAGDGSGAFADINTHIQEHAALTLLARRLLPSTGGALRVVVQPLAQVAL